MAPFRDRGLRRSPHFDRVNLAAAGRLEDTPQGYLWCRDVPLARTGTMDYAPYEVPRIPSAPGQRVITVERTADEVFSPEAIASFRGMPLTDDHPDDFVFAHNHREHAIGEIHDPRRGEGEHADCLVADLLVKDSAAIALIKSRRKRELSCGYDADYADVRPGYGRQVNIRGNHVSLVDAGRAGSRIAIRDRLMTPKLAPARKRSIADAVLAVFGSKDAAERQEQKRLLDEAMPAEPDDKGDGHTVNVVVHPPAKDDEPPKPGEGEPKPEKTDMDEDKVKEIAGAAMDEKLAPVMEAIKALSDKFDAVGTKADQAGEKADAVAEALEDMSDPDDMGMQDAIARAEILAPGLTLPARDAKPGSKAHRDALCTFQREALKRACTTDTGRAVVTEVLGHAQPARIGSLPDVAVATAFRSASRLMAGMNTTDAGTTLESATSGYIRDDAGQRVRPMNSADLAKLHRDHYAQKRA